MGNIEFDNKIKGLIDSYEEPIGEELWGAIESGLNRRYRFTLYRYIGSVAAAASLVLGVIFGVGVGSNGVNESHSSAQIALNIDTPEIQVEQPKYPLKRLSIKEFGLPSPVTENVLKVEDSDKKSEKGEETTNNEDKAVALSYEESTLIKGGQNSSNTLSEESWLYEQEDNSPKKNRGMIIGLSSNMLALSSSSMPSGRPQYAPGMNMNIQTGIVPISKPSFSIPLTFGLDLLLPINNRISVGTGVNYSLLMSNFQALIDNSSEGMVDQTIHYIGVPLSLYVNILNNKSFFCYLKGGAAIEKGINISSKIVDIIDGVEYRSASIHGLQYSANVGIGLQYLFNDFVGIYFDPSVVYFFDSKQPFSVRTVQPLQLNLELGLRFNL